MDRMIRRLFTFLALVSAVTILAATQTQAQESTPMTNEHIERVRDNCQAAQTVLSKLRASDALLRVNRGQLYELLSTKLMARMNSRLAINRLDASRLIVSTANFDRTLTEFRTRYQAYKDQMSSTLRVDCYNQPVEFYQSVKKSRELRQAVHESVIDLGRYINEYGDEFKAFQDNFRQTKPGANS